MPEWLGKVHRHPRGKYFLWGAGAVTTTFLVIFAVTLLPPALGSAQGLTRSLAADDNVTPMANIPNVGAGDPSINGQTLKQQCQARVPQQHWGICCSPPEYAASDACQKALKEQQQGTEPQPNQGGEGQPWAPAELKLLPIGYQKEYLKLEKQIAQYEEQADKVNAEVEQMRDCELGCPGGALAVQCTEENKDVCVAHDACIRACDKNFDQLKRRYDKLKKTESELTKKAAAFQKKADAYKLKNKRKFRSTDGARH